jgi:poly(A) polymerase
VDLLLQHRSFRIAYDFLVLRSQSINPELKKVANFWTEAQRNNDI